MSMYTIPADNVFELSAFTALPGGERFTTYRPNDIYVWVSAQNTDSVFGLRLINNQLYRPCRAILASKNNNPNVFSKGDNILGHEDVATRTITNYTQYTYNGKVVYYAVVEFVIDLANSSGELYNLVPAMVPSTVSSTDIGKMAWLMVWGGYDEQFYPVSYSLTHATYDSNNPTTISSFTTEETSRTFRLTVDENYDFDSSNVSVTNCSYEYESNGRNIILHLYAPTGDVVISVNASTDDPYAGEGDGTIGGADVGVPGLPSLGNVSAGLFSLFAPTAGQMNALADFLWTDIDFSQVISATDTTGALNAIANIFQEIGEAFKREIANPAKMIFGLSIIPSQGLAIGGAANVKIGFVDTGVAMNVLTNRYFTVDCGGVSIAPVCGNTFLDYAPYSKFSIYLPYIGVKPLDANDCVGHTISVKYNCDAVSGGCVCYVLKDGAVYYQYAGNVAMNLPLSSESWANTIAAAMNTASQLAAGVATGGVAGAGAAALNAASNVAANPSQLSPQIDHSGAVNGAAGYLGVQYPYIIREAVRFLDTAGMNEIKGYPSHYLTQLSNVSGYTEVLECHLEGIKATGNELTEIENLLKSGVII